MLKDLLKELLSGKKADEIKEIIRKPKSIEYNQYPSLVARPALGYWQPNSDFIITSATTNTLTETT